MRVIRVDIHSRLRFAFVSFVGLFCAIFLCNGAASAQVDTTSHTTVDSLHYPDYVIRGVILDLETGDPVRYTKVTVTSHTDTTRVFGAADGFFQIFIDSDFMSTLSELEVSCEHFAYFDTTITELNFPNETASVKIYLRPGSNPVEVSDDTASKATIIQIDPEMLKRLPVIGPIVGPPCVIIGFTFDADYYRTESVNFGDDDF